MTLYNLSYQEMTTTFNSKYDNYVQELPPFILKRIELKISKKYPLDAQNTDIDRKQQCSYQKTIALLTKQRNEYKNQLEIFMKEIKAGNIKRVGNKQK